MSNYRVLKKQIFELGSYKLVPIRLKDRYFIMNWRNEQIFHLRQNQPLTKDGQDQYFNDIVLKLFDQKNPDQILFSYLEGDKCIGYGGLVHINWRDANAEVSFLMETKIEKDDFEFHWTTFLNLIEQVAFKELGFHKIFTYAFDLRPRLYTALLQSGFVKEAHLKEHVNFESKYIDVFIHAKINEKIYLRKAGIKDLETAYIWANDKSVRAFAYNQSEISLKDHTIWFINNIESENCGYYILEVNQKALGSIRFDIAEDNLSAKINYLIDPKFTGKGYGTFLLEKGGNELLKLKPNIKSLYGYVLKRNIASIKIFKKLGYTITFENDKELKFEKILM